MQISQFCMVHITRLSVDTPAQNGGYLRADVDRLEH
jgi:hypothetical protein